jgi:hypothetical protein
MGFSYCSPAELSEAVADFRTAQVEEEDESEEALDDIRGDTGAVEAVEVSGGHQEASCVDYGPAPTLEAEESEDADDHQGADAEDAHARSACAEGAAHGGKGIEHCKQKEIHADHGHAGEKWLAAGNLFGHGASFDGVVPRQEGRNLLRSG